MKHTHQLTLTPQQCQVLSALTRTTSTQGLAYPAIMLVTDLSRPVLYVQARRLVARKLARKVHVRIPGSRVRQVQLAITAAGTKARAAYAFELGVWPP